MVFFSLLVLCINNSSFHAIANNNEVLVDKKEFINL